MSITRDSTLVDVAFVVCTALDRDGTVAVLTGGSAATFYASGAHQSDDVDFVITLVGDRARSAQTVIDLGYHERGGVYHHAESRFTLEFPPGPLGIGADLISSFETVHRADDVLHVISRTDSVRDRLAAFYHWDDRSGLQAAVAVAGSGEIDLEAIKRWSQRERMEAKYAQFATLYHAPSLGTTTPAARVADGLAAATVD